VVYGEIGEWNIRKAALSGKMNRLIRWVWKNIDKAEIKVREMGAQGKNVSRFIIVGDLNYMSQATNINFASTPLYVALTIGIDQRFPGLNDKIYMINSKFILISVKIG
jgi:hypothetical protein